MNNREGEVMIWLQRYVGKRLNYDSQPRSFAPNEFPKICFFLNITPFCIKRSSVFTRNAKMRWHSLSYFWVQIFIWIVQAVYLLGFYLLALWESWYAWPPRESYQGSHPMQWWGVSNIKHSNRPFPHHWTGRCPESWRQLKETERLCEKASVEDNRSTPM